MRIADAALEGVGRDYKEQLHHLFEYDFDVHKSHLTPAELRLPGGLVVQVRLNERSPYVVRRDDTGLYVEDCGQRLSNIEWLARPEFYSRKT